MQIDHKDGNGLNNSIDNLRLVSLGENLKNKSKYTNNTSGCAGVSWHNTHKKWHILATQGSALISDTLRVSMMQLL
ncbi:HNH endonuclease [Escherichia whittamii]|nr:HNH endonuclease [Escherichia whittamii]